MVVGAAIRSETVLSGSQGLVLFTIDEYVLVLGPDEVLFLVALEGRDPPVPGGAVRNLQALPASSRLNALAEKLPEHSSKFRDATAQWDRPSQSQRRALAKARGALRVSTDEVTRHTRESLESALNTGVAGTEVHVELIERWLADAERPERVADLINAALTRFSPVGFVCRLFAMALRRQPLRRMKSTLARIASPEFHRQVNWVLCRTLSEAMGPRPTIEALTQQLEGVAGLWRSKQMRARLNEEDLPFFAGLIDLRQSRHKREALLFLLRVGFRLLYALSSGFDKVTVLSVQATESLKPQLSPFPGADRDIRVLLFEESPTRDDLQILAQTLLGLDAHLRKRPYAHFALAIHDGVAQLEPQYRRLAGGYVYFVPLDLSVCALDIDAGRAALVEALRRYVGGRDTFAQSAPASGEGFFGRQAEFRRVADLFDRGSHVGLFGLRKMGKTSFLKELPNRRRFDLIAYLDLQAVPPGLGAAYVYWALARELARKLASAFSEVTLSAPLLLGSKASWREVTDQDAVPVEFAHDVEIILDALAATRRETKVILTLDEIELLVPGQRGAIPGGAELFRFLRGLSNRTDGRLLTLVAGANPLIAEAATLDGRDNPMFQMYAELHFPPLARDEADEMIRTLADHMGLSFDDEALDVIADEAGGHPHLTRRLCSHVIARNPGVPALQADHVRGAIESFSIDNAAVLEEIVGRLRTLFPNEYDALLAVAGRPLTAAELEALAGGPVETTLKHLVGYQLIASDPAGRFQLRFGLLRRWLERMRRFESAP